MLALYRSGRQAEALAAFREAQKYLAEELGVEPTAQLQQLHMRILATDPTLAGPTAQPAAVSAAPEPEPRPPTPAQLPRGMRHSTGGEPGLARLHSLSAATDGDFDRAVVDTATAGTPGLGRTCLA